MQSQDCDVIATQHCPEPPQIQGPSNVLGKHCLDLIVNGEFTSIGLFNALVDKIFYRSQLILKLMVSDNVLYVSEVSPVEYIFTIAPTAPPGKLPDPPFIVNRIRPT